jgi:hypothetical protein
MEQVSSDNSADKQEVDRWNCIMSVATRRVGAYKMTLLYWLCGWL